MRIKKSVDGPHERGLKWWRSLSSAGKIATLRPYLKNKWSNADICEEFALESRNRVAGIRERWKKQKNKGFSASEPPTPRRQKSQKSKRKKSANVKELKRPSTVPRKPAAREMGPAEIKVAANALLLEKAQRQGGKPRASVHAIAENKPSLSDTQVPNLGGRPSPRYRMAASEAAQCEDRDKRGNRCGYEYTYILASGKKVCSLHK